MTFRLILTRYNQGRNPSPRKHSNVFPRICSSPSCRGPVLLDGSLFAVPCFVPSVYPLAVPAIGVPRRGVYGRSCFERRAVPRRAVNLCAVPPSGPAHNAVVFRSGVGRVLSSVPPHDRGGRFCCRVTIPRYHYGGFLLPCRDCSFRVTSPRYYSTPTRPLRVTRRAYAGVFVRIGSVRRGCIAPQQVD